MGPSGEGTYPVFDSDNHLYETADAFLRHLPRKYAGSIRYVQVEGRTKIALRGVISDYIPNPTFEVVARPGAFRDYVTGHNPQGRTLRQITGEPMRSIPAFTDPDARLDVLDGFGIDATLLFPTLASVLEVNFMDDPELALAVIHAFNQWLAETWTFDYKGRIYATPVINLSTCEGGIAELEWVVGQGAKVVLVRPAAVGGYRGPRSPFLSEFDPFWARVQDAGILTTLHLSDSGYTRFANEWTGQGVTEWRPFQPSAFAELAVGHRPIMDAVFSLVAHGMLSRFPGVKVASVENGSSWLPRVIEDLETVYAKMPQEFDENPVEVLQRQLWVNPFWEDPLGELSELIGVDHILFGSDWPHAECLDDPRSWHGFAIGSGFSPSEVARMMGSNLADLMGVSLPG